jgi:hypothetical protein
MCWNENNYYIVTYSTSFDSPFTVYRVDRMTDVKMQKDVVEKYDKEKFNLNEYIK